MQCIMHIQINCFPETDSKSLPLVPASIASFIGTWFKWINIQLNECVTKHCILVTPSFQPPSYTKWSKLQLTQLNFVFCLNDWNERRKKFSQSWITTKGSMNMLWVFIRSFPASIYMSIIETLEKGVKYIHN